MKDVKDYWSKTELKLYILMFCAKVDQHEDESEIALIKSKTDPETFDKLYTEFCGDDEDTCYEKIEDSIGRLPFSPREIADIKKEVMDVFESDKKFQIKERYLDQVLANMLY